MRAGFFLIILTILAACSSQKQIAVNEEAVAMKPSWVQSRPISSINYVGIGIAQKTSGSDYRNTAKQNALSDLASEIKVNVNANSLLYTLEREYKFEQEFRETIRTSSNLDLEDFKLVEVWEDASSYWVYYTLDKATYAEKQRQKKESAESLAIDFLSKAESAQTDGRFAESIDFYLRGLQSLEEFWGESNEGVYRGNNVYIDNELFSGLKTTLNSVLIEADEPPVLNFQNSYQTNGEYLVTQSTSGLPLSGVPLDYSYQGLYGRIKGNLSTNMDGRAIIPVTEAERSSKPNKLTLEVDREALFDAFTSDRFMRKLTESLTVPSQVTTIQYNPPLVHIEASEKNLGEEMSGEPITAAIISSLNRKGVRFTQTAKKSDVIIKLNSDTKETGETQGFSTVRLEVNVEVIDPRAGESVYKVSKSDIKGVDLSFEKAGIKAYQNFTKNIESELMRKLSNDLF